MKNNLALLKKVKQRVIMGPSNANSRYIEQRTKNKFLNIWGASQVAPRIHLPCRRCRFNPWVGKIPGGGNGNPLQYSCLENYRNREAWLATVHGIAKSWMQLGDWAHMPSNIWTHMFIAVLLTAAKRQKQLKCLIRDIHPLKANQFNSGQSLSHVCLFAIPWNAACQASLSPTPRACSNSCPSRWWCHSTISSSAVPFSSSLQYFPQSVSFPISQFFASGGQNIGASAPASVLPMNI